MKAENIYKIPYLSLLIVICIYSGLLMLPIIKLAEWYRSEFYMTLIYLYPLIMLFIGIINYKKRKISKYHSGIYIMAFIYVIIAIIVGSAFYLIE